MSCLIIGCGYIGRAVADLAVGSGQEVYAVTRSEAKGNELARQSIQPIVHDWLSESDWPVLPKVTNVLVSVSHASIPGLSPDLTHVRGLRSLFGAIGHNDLRYVYLSTTGLFGARSDGAWLDEASTVSPTRPGSIAAYSAEQWLCDHVVPSHRCVLRLAGIYGPGRIPNLERFQQTGNIEVDPDSYLNLIHRDDAAAIAYRCLNAPTPSSLYCVSDGHPVLRRDYYGEIARWLNLPEPTYTPSQRRPDQRGGENKRISNRKLLDELGYPFLFPDFRTGLLPLLSQNRSTKEEPHN